MDVPRDSLKEPVETCPQLSSLLSGPQDPSGIYTVGEHFSSLRGRRNAFLNPLSNLGARDHGNLLWHQWLPSGYTRVGKPGCVGWCLREQMKAVCAGGRQAAGARGPCRGSQAGPLSTEVLSKWASGSDPSSPAALLPL